MTSTAKPENVKAALFSPEKLAPYLDKLAEHQANLGTALKITQARTQRIGAEWMDSYLASQRDMLELTKKVLLKPQDFDASMKSAIEASAANQERAITLAKQVYREHADVFTEVRKWFQSSTDAAGALTQPGRGLMSFWSRQA